MNTDTNTNMVNTNTENTNVDTNTNSDVANTLANSLKCLSNYDRFEGSRMLAPRGAL